MAIPKMPRMPKLPGKIGKTPSMPRGLRSPTPSPSANTPAKTNLGKLDMGSIKGPSTGPNTPSAPKPPTKLGLGVSLTKPPKLPGKYS